jgi:hypothetical protein
MITLLIWLLFLVIIFGLVWWIITLIPLPAPFGQVAQVVVAVIFLLVLLSVLLGGIPLQPIRLN